MVGAVRWIEGEEVMTATAMARIRIQKRMERLMKRLTDLRDNLFISMAGDAITVVRKAAQRSICDRETNSTRMS